MHYRNLPLLCITSACQCLAAHQCLAYHSLPMPHATACATAACQCFVLPKPACALLYSRSFVPCSTASRYVNESQYYIIYILCVEILNIYLFIFTAARKCFALPQPENALHNLSTPMPCGTAAANSLRCCSLQVPCATATIQCLALLFLTLPFSTSAHQ